MLKKEEEIPILLMFICSSTFTCRGKVPVGSEIKGSDLLCWKQVTVHNSGA